MKKYEKTLTHLLCTQRGVSLVEVITVLVIIAVAGAFAAPDVMQWAENKRVTSAARDLLADMNNARLTAVERNGHVVMVLDEANEKYSFFLDNGAGGGTTNNSTQDGSEPTLFSKNFGDDAYDGTNISGTQNTNDIGFTSRGTPINGDNAILLDNNPSADKTNLWLKVVLNKSGSITLLKSDDGSTWK